MFSLILLKECRAMEDCRATKDCRAMKCMLRFLGLFSKIEGKRNPYNFNNNWYARSHTRFKTEKPNCKHLVMMMMINPAKTTKNSKT
jgi:hypothetical protein